jgi:hypothetical protein
MSHVTDSKLFLIGKPELSDHEMNRIHRKTMAADEYTTIRPADTFLSRESNELCSTDTLTVTSMPTSTGSGARFTTSFTWPTLFTRADVHHIRHAPYALLPQVYMWTAAPLYEVV